MTNLPRPTNMDSAAATGRPFAAFFSCANIAILLGTVIAVSIILVSMIILPVSAVSAALILVVVRASDPPRSRSRYRS